MIKILNLKGIDNNIVVSSLLPFPENKLELNNGTLLTPTKDMPWFNLKKGQQFPIIFDGEYIRAGGLSWSIQMLIEEIEAGYWEKVQ